MNAAPVPLKAVGTRAARSRTAPIQIAARGIAVDFVHDGRRQRVLQDMNIEVPKGSLVSLIGPSGCGKSTLLKVMAGLVLPAEGDISRRRHGAAGSRPRTARSGSCFRKRRCCLGKMHFENAAFLLMTADETIPKSDAMARAADMLGSSTSTAPSARCLRSFRAACASALPLRGRSRSILKSC